MFGSREDNQTDGNKEGSSRAFSIWREIWKTKTLPKVKMFMWKLVSNSIAVPSNLVQQAIPITLTCPLCDKEETKEHLNFGCEWVRKVRLDTVGLCLDGSVP